MYRNSGEWRRTFSELTRNVDTLGEKTLYVLLTILFHFTFIKDPKFINYNERLPESSHRWQPSMAPILTTQISWHLRTTDLLNFLLICFGMGYFLEFTFPTLVVGVHLSSISFSFKSAKLDPTLEIADWKK